MSIYTFDNSCGSYIWRCFYFYLTKPDNYILYFLIFIFGFVYYYCFNRIFEIEQIIYFEIFELCTFLNDANDVMLNKNEAL